MVIRCPVGNRTQRGTGLESLRGTEQRHEAHEAAVAAAVNADIGPVALVIGDHVIDAVKIILQLRMAHLPVDGGPPVAAVTFRGAVVHVEHHVALLHQQVVEHLFAKIHRVTCAYVLQIAGAVHEHRDRVFFSGLGVFRAVQFGPDHPGAVFGRHLHVFRLDPVARLKLRAAGVGQFPGLAVAGIHHGQLHRQVAARVAHGQTFAVRRQAEVLDAIKRGHFTKIGTVTIDAADLVITRPAPVAQEVGLAALGIPLHAAGFIVAGGQHFRSFAFTHIQMAVAALFGQIPEAVVGQEAEFVEAPVDPGRIGQAVTDGQFAAGEIDADQPAVLVVDGAHHQRNLRAVGAPYRRCLHAHRPVAFQRIEFLGLA